MADPAKIEVAVLGLGAMGATHAGAAQASPFVGRVYGYEPDPARCAQRARELGVTAAGLDEIMNNPAVKLVSIASVNEVHAEQAIMALRAGKAVLCEKPPGITLAEARAILDAEKETGNFLQVGFELRYSTLYRRVKEWIDQGLIGTPLNCHCRYYCSEFHLKGTWRSRSRGTLVGEKLSHYLDLQRWWFGDAVESVYSYNAPNAVKYFNHPDNHQVSARFRRGGVANLNFVMYLGETDYADPLLEMLDKQSDDGHFLQFHLFGDRGAIETDVFRRRLRRWEFTDSPRRLVSRIVETVRYSSADDLAWAHNTHGQNLRIAELVARGLPPEVPAADAFETMKLCFVVERSERENRVVKMSEFDGD